MKAINTKLVLDWKEASSKAEKLEEQIINRIDYILKTWFNIYGSKLEYWYFDGAAEGEVGDLNVFMNKDSIYNFYVSAKNFPENDLAFIDKDGDEYVWQSEIPTRWLYDDNFEEEIRQGKIKLELYEQERKAKKKQAAALKKETDSKLIAKAKAKLSKEELAALKKVL